MARILVLNPPFLGLSTIVNVKQRVGPKEANEPNDVRVVQTLLGMIKSNFSKTVGLPKISGNYDAATGFWIYDTQFFTKQQHPNVIVDGIVSPARGSVYAAGAPWTIVLFNHFAQKDSPAEYASFVSQISASP